MVISEIYSLINFAVKILANANEHQTGFSRRFALRTEFLFYKRYPAWLIPPLRSA